MGIKLVLLYIWLAQYRPFIMSAKLLDVSKAVHKPNLQCVLHGRSLKSCMTTLKIQAAIYCTHIQHMREIPGREIQPQSTVAWLIDWKTLLRSHGASHPEHSLHHRTSLPCVRRERFLFSCSFFWSLLSARHRHERVHPSRIRLLSIPIVGPVTGTLESRVLCLARWPGLSPVLSGRLSGCCS